MGDSNLSPGSVVAADAGRVTVQTPFGDVEMAGERTVGEAATLSVRPQHLTVGGDGPIVLGSGRVVEEHFLGTHQRCRVTLDGQQLIVHVPARQRVPGGADVQLSMDPGDLILVADPRDHERLERGTVEAVTVD